LIVVYAVGDAALPAADCDGSNDASGSAETLALLVAAGASLSCLAGAVLHLARLRRANDGSASVGIAIIAGVVALGAILIAIGGDLFFIFFFAGLIGTGLCFLATVALIAYRRTPDLVGVTLSLYLTGMALFVYPPLLLLFALCNSGLGC
jgi:hypothetical protein